MNENPSAQPPVKRGGKKRVGYFDPLRWSGLPGFWLYLIGAFALTAIIAVGGSYLLIKLGLQ